jgi:uncharacterized RDD family membrane protein YckC
MRIISTKNHFRLRLVSALLDISAIYCIASLLQVLIYKFTFIAFGNIFIGVFIAYYFLSYIVLDGRTPAKIFTGLKIISIKGSKATPLTIFSREIILKGLFGIWLPLYFFENVPLRTHALKTSFEMLLLVVISAIYLLVFKRTWWEWLSRTSTIKDKNVSKACLNYAFYILAVVYIAFISVTIRPVILNSENLLTRLPAPYPRTKEVKQYAAYIRSHSQDPVDYVFDLFKKYDIVVISERMHPEYSQYEFIFKLIKDKRFSENVGNLFTECGSVSYQDSLNNYLNTPYKTEDDLNHATARLQRNSSAVWPLWNCTNLFDLFRTVHFLNSTLPDSSKINWYFTDLPVNWGTATHETYIKNYTTPHRNSLMAVQVIEKYNRILSRQKRKKALVIMNTYHGYGLAPDGKNYFGSTTAYIMKALPGKVSNVMINYMSMKYLTAFVPVQNGKWDAAFEMAGNPVAGFNFAGSPFGDDHFDARYEQIRGLSYKDEFTGFIFYTPLSTQFCKNGFPFEVEYSENEILKRAACVSPGHVDIMKRIIEYQKAHPGNPYTAGPTRLPMIYNLIHLLIVPFLMFISLTTIMILFLVKRKQINKLPLSNNQP